MGGSSGGQKSTTTNVLSPEIGAALNKYLEAVSNIAFPQAQALSQYSTPLLQQALGLGQQETFGTNPGTGPNTGFPGVSSTGGVYIPGAQPQMQPQNPWQPPPPQNPLPNPYQYPVGGGPGAA